MAKRKYNKNKGKKDEANEPFVQYVNASENKIHFFSSLEKQEEDNYSYLAELTPLQHLINATALIKEIFAENIKKNKTNYKRIIFDK